MAAGADVLAVGRGRPDDRTARQNIVADVQDRAGAGTLAPAVRDGAGLDLLVPTAGGSRSPGDGDGAVTDVDWTPSSA